MCPVCVTNALLVAVSASSTGGLTALAMKKLCWKSKRNHQTENTREEQNENRINESVSSFPPRAIIREIDLQEK
jgi:hypothetical protein